MDGFSDVIKKCPVLKDFNHNLLYTGRNPDKSYDGLLRILFPYMIIQLFQGFYKNINALVMEFIPSGQERQEGIVKLKLVIWEKIIEQKFVYFCFQVFVPHRRFVESREFINVKAVRQNDVRLPFQKIRGFNARY